LCNRSVVGPTLGGTEPIAVCCAPTADLLQADKNPMANTKSPEDYRRLAATCRETARTMSAENERADLLAMAETWDLIARRIGRPPRCGERPAATETTLSKWHLG